MQDKVLVAYASRTGSTAEVAEAIGKALHGEGDAVDIRPAKDVTDMSPYRAAIVGSAIYMGRWMSEAVKFVKTHRDALSRIPVAYFLVCLTLNEDNYHTVAAYVDPIRAMVKPVDVGLFTGRLDYSKLPFLYRLVAKTMKAPEGDFRNWEAIHTWATELRPRLR